MSGLTRAARAVRVSPDLFLYRSVLIMRRFRLIRACGLALLALALLVPALPAQAAATKVGTYLPLTTPSRLLDTRTGNGAPKQQLGSGKTLTLKVAGRGTVPTSGVSAVVINVTVTNATATNGYLSVYPAGTSRPSASSINFAKGRTTANSATVKLGTGGSVAIYNSFGGSSDVVVDVSGYYTSSASASKGAGLQTVDPARLFDTRSDPQGPLASGEYLTYPVDYGATVNKTTKAVALNITAVGASRNGYLTAWNGDEAKVPGASTLNYEKTTAVANLAIVPTRVVKGLPEFGIANGGSGPVDVIADVVGLYTDDSNGAGLRFTPITPTRIADSRLDKKPLMAKQTQQREAPASVTTSNTYGLLTNTAAIAPTSTTFLTLWDAGTKPPVSNLNAPAGRTVANGTITIVDADYSYSIYNNAGTTNFLVDVTGRFDAVDDTAAAKERLHLHPATAHHARLP